MKQTFFIGGTILSVFTYKSQPVPYKAYFFQQYALARLGALGEK
jgi:hypothetical protein